MKIRLKKILKILSLLQPGLISGSVYEQASHFIFDGKQVWTYNDLMCVIYPLETDFSFSIEAKEFFSLCSRLSKTSFISISLILENGNLLIKAKKKDKEFKGSIKVQPNIEEITSYFNQLSLKQEEWNILPKNFVEGVDLCLLSLSDDITDRRFSSIHVHKNYLLSSDDIRITKVDLSSPIKEPFVMPGFNLSHFSKFIFDEYLINLPWVYFKSKNGIILCVRLVKQELLVPGTIFDFEKEEIPIPKNFKEIIELCTVSSDEKEAIISFCFANNTLTCEGSTDTKHFTMKQEQDTKPQGENQTFTGNSLFLKQLFDIANIKDFKMFCCKEKKKLLFTSEKIHHLLALVNVKED